MTFESVYRAHSKTVGRWAACLLGPTHDGEDVVQEVFLVVRRRLPEFRGDAEVTTWLYEITVRVVQRFRRRARWWSWVTGQGRSPGRGRTQESLQPADADATDPHALLEAREMTRVLYQLLDQLSVTQRTAFILYELEGLSGEQIAAITGATVRTVYVRLSRARHRFLASMRAWEERERP
jgi:RNA polymerase sigma-70 factor, ECF subfamily